jgi:hypothetical protein
VRRVWPRKLELVLEPGNNLDAYIHEELFGACAHHLTTYEEDEDPWDDYIPWRCSKCAKTFRGLSYGRYGHTQRLLCPEYSTSDEAALTFMYRLRDANRIVSVDFEPKGTFSASILTKDPDNTWTLKGMVGHQKTFPMAICVAAIRSMKDVASED